MNNKQTKIIFQETNKFNKPNVLINVVKSKDLSLKDKKVYNVLLRLLLDQDLRDFQTSTIKTTISQICYMLNIKNRNDINDCLNKLEDTKIVFDHLIDNEEVQTSTRLITSNSVYKKNENSVIIEFSQLLTKEILINYQRYTKLDLIEMNNLKVGHSLTLYELIKSKLYKYKYQYQNYTEQELRKYLNLEDKYLNIKQFNQMVIRKSIKDINDHTELDLTLLKISKKDNVRVYHLQVKYESFSISLSTFRDTMRYLVKNKFQQITFKWRKNIYSLEEQMDFGTEKHIGRIYWLNNETGKTISTDLADIVWEELFTKYRTNLMNFIENDLGIQQEDWIDAEFQFTGVI